MENAPRYQSLGCGSDAIPLGQLEVNSNICRDLGNALRDSGPKFEWLEAGNDLLRPSVT